MMSRRRGLGSGLDALIGGSTVPEQTVRQINIEAIRENRSQPRTRFDEQALDELAASIREHGLIQPVIVVALPEGDYELIAGERRLRAARRAGLSQIPALIKEATPQQFLELALVENVQRADLNPLEEGMAYQTLKDEFGLTDEEIARRVGKSRVAIVNARRLIRLVQAARQALLDSTISAGHGRAILRFEDEEQQVAALHLITEHDLSVREAERLAEVAQDKALSAETRHALLSGQITISQAQTLLQIVEASQQNTILSAMLSHKLSLRDTELLAETLAEGLPLQVAMSRLQYSSGSSKISEEAVPSAPAVNRPPKNRHETSTSSPEDDETRRMFEAALSTPVHITRSGSTIKLTITLYNEEQLQSLYDVIVEKQ